MHFHGTPAISCETKKLKTISNSYIRQNITAKQQWFSRHHGSNTQLFREIDINIAQWKIYFGQGKVPMEAF